MPSDESKGSQLDAIGSLAQRQLDNTFIEHARVERDDARATRIDFEATDDGLRAPLQHPNDASFGFSFASGALDMHEHAIPVQRVGEVRPRDVDILKPALVRYHEAEAAPFHVEPPGDDVHLFRKPDPVGMGSNELALCDHLLDDPLRRLAVPTFQAKLLQEVFFRRGAGQTLQAFSDLTSNLFVFHSSVLKTGSRLCTIPSFTALVPKWRNGRRAAFRAQFPSGSGGSNPPFGTNER